MLVIQDWLTVFVLGCLVVMFPGPNFAMILRNSLLRSRRAGLYTALGIALGGTVHVTYSLIGIGVIISQSILLFNALKWLGAFYLIAIGLKALWTQKHPIETPNGSIEPHMQMSRQAALQSGFLTCLLNPKSTLFFFALFTQVIRPDTLLPVRTLYGMTIVGIQLTWYSTVALVISHQFVQRRFSSTTHWIERATGGVMIALGIRLALTHGKS
jgi:RhtB (resistance to homoserine/threonine) family protein